MSRCSIICSTCINVRATDHLLQFVFVWSVGITFYFGDELTSRPRRRDDQGDELTSHRGDWGGGGEERVAVLRIRAPMPRLHLG